MLSPIFLSVALQWKKSSPKLTGGYSSLLGFIKMIGNESVTQRINQIETILLNYKFRFSCENELQTGIENVLQISNIEYVREKSISKRDRPDFIIDGIAVEIKIKGSLSTAIRQVARYASHDDIRAVLVIGTPFWILRIPKRLHEKEILSIRLIGSLL
ncbi:hypothetical protein [Methylomonas sp. AM2-LC]|uniref:hypothetical protein n=1 Tax=Methylomonas sp. AM2-LC TaxID=3153301 RepID=UPI00326797E7